jgi:dTDP-4-amino-4,6-dideoxygalactose transaminase
MAGHYDRLLSASGITPQPWPHGTVLLRYPIMVDDRDRLLEEAADRHIELSDWFNHPLHPAGACLDNLNWDQRECPTAVSVARNVVNLPLHDHVSERYAEKCLRFVMGAALRCQERRKDGGQRTEDGASVRRGCFL